MKAWKIAAIVAACIAGVGGGVLTVGIGSAQDGKLFQKSDMSYWFKSEPQPAYEVAEPIKGDKGDKGDKGEPGKDGADGEDGKDGQDGEPGKDGLNGADGLTPYVGANGNWYIGDTDTGIKAAGTDGADGADGLTPYVGANGNWYIGDTDTGIKAAGTDGKDGADGKDGLDGEPGKDGADGLTPYIGANGNWYIGDTDTGIKAAGTDGVDGKDGQDGKDGEDGKTPYIGANGNWFIGGNDTGVSATGGGARSNAITEYYETTFTDCYGEDGRWFVRSPDKLSLISYDAMGGNTEGRAYLSSVGGGGKRLYRNTLSAGLKMETYTLITFETGVPMTLNVWLDNVWQTGATYRAFMLDNDCVTLPKVSGDEIGYEGSIYLPAGVHTIRKKDTCVLSYLSLTPAV